MLTPRRGWNPKRLGVVKSKNARHETEVWLYVVGQQLDIVVSVNLDGRVLGQTVHTVRLPRCPKRG